MSIEWADLRFLRVAPKSLSERIRGAVDYYSCHLLFVHRDAESASAAQRKAEIERASRDVACDKVVCVVPVRMTEAWLLFDEPSIREAAGNPRGVMPIDLPPIQRVEQEPDPKSRLHQAIRAASGLRGRRLKSLNVRQAVHRIATIIEDDSPLRGLPSFKELEGDIVKWVAGTTGGNQG